MATQAKRDYYEILSVSRTATEQEIKSSFAKVAAAIQAEGKPSGIAEVERIREITTAYRVLSDPAKRRRYDETGHGFIGDDGNRLDSVQDKLDELLKWLEESRAESSSDIIF